LATLLSLALVAEACGGPAQSAKPIVTTVPVVTTTGHLFTVMPVTTTTSEPAATTTSRPVPTTTAAQPAGPTTSEVPTTVATAERSADGAFICADPQLAPTLQGTPDITPIPSLQSVSLLPKSGGLQVTFTFSKALVDAQPGVYLSWYVYLFRRRIDASNQNARTTLLVRDWGQGTLGNGWQLTAVPPGSSAQGRYVDVPLYVNNEAGTINVTFPAGFVDLGPPFYWYAEQQGSRQFVMKNGVQDPEVNGYFTNECPAGVTDTASNLPSPARLLPVT
jgi:hypothetical protein